MFALEFSLRLLTTDFYVSNTRAKGAYALLLGKGGVCLILSAASWNNKALAFMAEVDGC